MTKNDQLYLKFPTNLECSAQDLKDYARYLFLKRIDRQGYIQYVDLRDHKKTNYNWMRAMLKRGWALKVKGGYQMKAYQYVWKSMGIERVVKSKTNLEAFKYLTLPSYIKEYSPKEFFNYCIKYFREHQAKRKKKQIVFRLLQARGGGRKVGKNERFHQLCELKITQQPEFSTTSAMNLFGYKSASSGRKMLFKYMNPCLDAFPKREWKCIDGKPIRHYSSWRIWLD